MRDADYPDPEGYTRYGGNCVCGAVYTYAGIPDPAGFDPDCPDHGDPAYMAGQTATPTMTSGTCPVCNQGFCNFSGKCLACNE